DLLHDDDRTLKQLVVGQAHDEVTRLSGGIEAHRDLRELGQAYRQVYVAQRVVGGPAAAIATRVRAIDRAAIVELAIEALGPREMRFEAGVADSAKLRRREARERECHGREEGDSPEPHRDYCN